MKFVVPELVRYVGGNMKSFKEYIKNFNKYRLLHFEWTWCGQRYMIDWTAVTIIGGVFFLGWVYQHYYS